MKKRMLAVLLLIICVMPINGCAFDKFTKSGNTNKNEDILIIDIRSLRPSTISTIPTNIISTVDEPRDIKGSM